MSKKLSEYTKKRDFRKTGEPSGKAAGDHNRPLFVIQKHDASTLHYDFRLSIGGVLKSWAVPKGPSTAAGEKRLAVRTEDHPLDYADFEGVIPEDQYGGGVVMVWDRGTFSPLEDDGDKDAMARQLKDGKLTFCLKGEKLQGGYSLVRMNTEDDNENWLLIKMDDDKADARRNPVSTEPDSVLSGRSLKDIARDDE
ncbi:DNA polymerase ligase N-terminal domain-containing protein [Marinobacter persicus]|uniref:DNA ligase D-like protein (Predicted 3'-phosphoesterase) n=1 Tax=Marinobacter persicus TaxID=930118 RepID=A0A2S6GA52_9GAMM|nr:DNA polymerase ligase N-terminal domain-containing protein [Marinobacter persicus]PPK53118.1 DNA ligase D-like protein (predicted 3'-phosphoesterase) [Marinobacter persicus]PPK55995.1 DNA ligase D-like protein (predicted 3'-phosphoesterase) [Marinobacter persicus]PPK59591.1 DNA ligase D-like protein (predicted 3'-phosphoesterase) [Marinobacter persicus]